MPVRTFLRTVPRGAWLTASVVAAAAIGLSVWTFGVVLPDQSAAARTITRTATAQLRTMEKSVSATGTVAPAVDDDVSFAVSGTVTAVSVKAGQTVKKGQTLAKVDTLQLNATLLQAKADLAAAESTLASARSADDGAAAATARVSAAVAAVDVARASVDDARSAMGDATLVAPAAGLVTAVNIAVGDKISGSGGSGSAASTGTQPAASSGGSGGSSSGSGGSSSSSSSSAAFTIVSTDAWTVDVAVGETDISHVTTGDQVELSTDDGTSYFGTVSEVGMLPSTSSGSAQYPVSIAVTGAGKGLFDGVSVTASIVYQRRIDVLAVPSMAVTTTAGKSSVTVVGADGEQTVRTVKVGEISGEYTEITSGLSEGTPVLVASFTPSARPGSSTQNGRSGTGQFPRSGQFTGGFTGGGFTGGGSFTRNQGGNQ